MNETRHHPTQRQTLPSLVCARYSSARRQLLLVCVGAILRREILQHATLAPTRRSALQPKSGQRLSAELQAGRVHRGTCQQDASIIIELQPSTLDSLAMACSTAVCLRAKRHMLAAVSRTSAAMREPRAFHYQAVKPVESCEHTCTSKTAEDQSTAC